jgi:hypothetical protein
MRTIGEFTVREGDRVPFALTWYPSNEEPPKRIDPEQALQDTVDYWTSWVERCGYDGTWTEAVLRSLIVLKALTYAPTGGIVAAPTTSLPERIGGERNWDYRYCWLRDATLVLLAFINAGFLEEATAWRTWLLRAAAGDPSALQIMYGVGGERRLTEYTLDWLPGYEGSRPVRAGNAASEQFQLDVFGEVLDAMHQGRVHDLERSPESWSLQRRLLAFLEDAWKEPDDGIWEVRGGRRHFTHSKVMAWVAFDRGVKAVEKFGRSGPADRWRKVREEIQREVCEHGFDRDLNSFTQTYGSKRLDASLLVLPLVGFLPATTGACSARSRRSSASSTPTASSTASRTTEASRIDGLPPARARSCRARSGSRTTRAAGPAGRGRGAVRAALDAQRPRAARGGVGSGDAAAARQLPAGVHARRARQQRVQPRPPAHATPRATLASRRATSGGRSGGRRQERADLGLA